ncbi:MAG: 4-hydroxy-2-oxovalerate aldolase [Eubacteriales bacterium]|nr:4-hydroxy-2-oxovalerate aldolase [Eubacteriales bacterium]
MRLFDCTLRDGANVAGLGFDRKLTVSMIEAMLACGITEIEFGNAHGIGCDYEPGVPLTDKEYLEVFRPYKGRGQFGMFLQNKAASEETVKEAKEGGLDFLRVGNLAGNGAQSEKAIAMVKAAGLKCRYAMMRVYLLTAEEAAQEAELLEKLGVDEITLMDSAGTMLAQEVSGYIREVKKRVSIPIGFHGHNNLGMAAANALAAMEAGADSLDCGLMGMARSAGNCSTELLIGLLQRMGKCTELDLYGLLDYIDQELEPEMKKYGFVNPLSPKDLIYGLSGCHSNVAPKIEKLAREYGVPVYSYIMAVTARDKRAPSEDLLKEVALEMKK